MDNKTDMSPLSYLMNVAGMSLDDINEQMKAAGLDNDYEELAKAIKAITDRGDDWRTGRPRIVEASTDVAEVFVHLETKSRRENGQTISTATNTLQNFLYILQNDSYFKEVRYSTLRNVPVVRTATGYRLWSDADDAKAMTYIESNYGIFNRPKYEIAFSYFQQSREFDPIREKIESVEWDGKERIADFFPKWLKTEKSPYTTECARLLFAGGINRAYNPGCKFDDVIVFQGNQGSGKTVMCQHLAMLDEFYCSLVTIRGKEGRENLDGKWIVELEELLATAANGKGNTEMEESAKAFISTRMDSYRKAYDRRAQDYPRHCIFIGTTNRFEFLTDSTGNRRWYPVKVNSDGRDLLDHATELDNDILQCWAEMKVAYDNHLDMAKAVVCLEVLADVKAAQNSAETEDPWLEQIAEYVKDIDRVCLREIWENCLYQAHAPRYPDCTKKDSCRLGTLLVSKLGWIRGEKPEQCGKYGRCKVFYNPNFPR